MVEPAVVDLFVALYEAHMSARRDRRGLMVSRTMSGTTVQTLDGGFARQVPDDDLHTLKRVGLIEHVQKARYAFNPGAGRYYEHVRSRLGCAAATVEETVQHRVAGEEFRGRYPMTTRLLNQAAATVFSEQGEHRATQVGHDVREALVAFPAELAKNLELDLEAAPDKTVQRLRELIRARAVIIGSQTTMAYLDAMAAYWGAVSDLGQRQEHGAQREDEQLTWEDSRRVVFAALALVYEVDRALT